MRKKRKRLLTIFILIIIIVLIIFMFFIKNKDKELVMIDLVNTNVSLIEKNLSKYNFSIEYEYEYNDSIEKDYIISQSILPNTKIIEQKTIKIIVSLGKNDYDKLKNDKINELGKVPIMMYHGIINKKDSETAYTLGNVDKDGYNRTTESFKRDLEFYYNNKYQMIRLVDYVNKEIDVSYGYSPIIITFDDGNDNNIKVTGLDKDGNIIIDENSAVGILEQFKKDHKDAKVTATFFVTGSLFNQKEYNDKVLKWLVDHGYDIGNHTNGHDNISTLSIENTQKTISSVYQKLDSIIPNKYVKIIALPFGAPYNKSHANFPYTLKGTYNNYSYENISALRVGWEPEVSSYDKSFDKTYLKRCRAYDNNGKEFDIEMVFNNLKNNKFISDGNKDTITIPNSSSDKLIDIDKKVIKY